MKRMISYVITALYSVLVINAQETKFGLYTRDKTKIFEQLVPSLIVDRNLSPSYIFSLEKPTITVYLEKDIASTAIETNNPEFFFYLPSHGSDTVFSLKSIVSLIKNYPFVYAESPEDFILVPIFKMRLGRAIRLEKEKYFHGMNFRALKQDKIDFDCISMPEDNAYKIVLQKILPPGEYGFIYNKPTPYDMVIYDFRIE